MAKWDLVTELFYNGQWNTARAYARNPVTMTRGKQDQQGGLVPSGSNATLDNRTGDYNPRYPLSVLYGLAGRNTPIRHYLGTPHVGDDNSSTSATTSHVAPSVTAPLAGVLVCVWASTPGTYTVPGSMTDGGAAGTLLTSLRGARQNVSAGATGTRTATFSASKPYVACSVLVNGPTTLSTGTARPTGDSFTLDGNPGDWWVLVSAFAASGGSPVAPDSPADTDGGDWIRLADTGDVDMGSGQLTRMKAWVKRVHTTNAAHTITLTGASSLTASFVTRVPAAEATGGWDVRATVEVAGWAPDRSPNFDLDAGTGDAWTGVDGAGVLLRLGQTPEPSESLMRRFALASAVQNGEQVAAQYWPCEDGSGATQFGSAITGGPVLANTGNTLITPASYSGFPGSQPLPVFNADTSFLGYAPSTPDTTGAIYFRMALFLPTGHSIPNGQNLFNIYTTGGNTTFFGIDYTTASSGSLTLNAVGAAGIIATTGAQAFGTGVNGKRILLYVELEQNGSNVDYTFGIYRIDDDGGFSGSLVASSMASVTAGRCYAISGGGNGTMEGCAFGHIGVGASQAFMFDLLNALSAYSGETAGNRFLRLCAEQGIPGSVVGDPDETVAMGAQPADSFLALLADIETTEAGIVYEQRAQAGLALRTRGSMYNQTAALALDWNTGQVSPPLSPIIDNRYVSNDVTAKRRDGSEAHAVQETGPLNINPPTVDAEGVGPYRIQLDVNPQSDDQLPDLAGWALRLGTIPDTRYSRLTVDLDRNPDLADTVSLVDVGDLVTIANTPLDLYAGTLRLLVVGYTETVEPARRLLVLNTIPETAYRVAEADGDARVDTDGTERGAPQGSIDTTQTGITMTITDGTFWTTDAADFPFDAILGGEQVTVTAIAAPSGSTQLFTVTRSVNGVVKSHPAGTKIHPLNAAYAPL